MITPEWPIIERAAPEDLGLADWAWTQPESPEARVTRRAFSRALGDGSMELLLARDRRGKVVGQLYIVCDSCHPEFASGYSRGYLCALTVRPGFRGQGIGKALVEKAASRLAHLGFDQAAIGVEERTPELKMIYKKWGFTMPLGRFTTDPWSLDQRGHPREVSPFILLCRQL